MKASQEDTRCPSAAIWRDGNRSSVAARIAIVGDFLPAGALRHAGRPWRDLASPLLGHFADIDTTFLNLECPVAVDGLSARPLNGIGQIVSAPPDVLDYLDAIHSRAVGIANNHIYDFGPTGVQRTQEALAARRFFPLGAARTLKTPPEIYVWHGPGNLRVGFWAAAKASRELAARTTSGVEPATVRRAAEALALLRRGGATFSIALLHAGTIRTNRPAPEDVTLLRELADSGFDLVAASHSHRIGGCERISRTDGAPAFCFHGLGSIVSGYTASEEEREGLIAIAGFDKERRLAEISVRPVFLGKRGFGEIPPPAEAHRILARFEELSSEIADGSYKAAFYRDVSRGLVRLYLRDAHAALNQSGVRGLARKAKRLRLSHVKRLVHRVFAT